MNINKVRLGHHLLVDGNPCMVVKIQLRQQPRLATKVITKLKNLLTGAVIEKIFTGNDDVPDADISTKKMKYLYNDDSNYYFMDNETFEQFEMTKEKIGDIADLIKDNADVFMMYFNEKPVNISLPPTVTLKVIEADPGVKGDTATGGLKNAKLETGITIQVPLFIEAGDELVINTENREYKERASKK